MGVFTINITKELVDRLAGSDEKVKKRTTNKPRQKVPKQPRPPPQPKVNVKQLRDDDPNPRKLLLPPPASAGWPVLLPVQPLVRPASAELDAIQSVVLESEKVLEKLQKQEERMVQKVTERAKDLHGKEFKLPYQKPMPCMPDYEACRACYKEHINDILRCSSLTKNYYECVQRVKQQAGYGDK
ncbi:unnamed protein product [Linum tenue]|uniref:Uncharacterized protein n=1 Tax=Linum tenue TaxID=586396 RepID=A0AAV0Q8C2_9ROSI|nr:unnamed protein product [Linum tenue]